MKLLHLTFMEKANVWHVLWFKQRLQTQVRLALTVNTEFFGEGLFINKLTQYFRKLPI